MLWPTCPLQPLQLHQGGERQLDGVREAQLHGLSVLPEGRRVLRLPALDGLQWLRQVLPHDPPGKRRIKEEVKEIPLTLKYWRDSKVLQGLLDLYSLIPKLQEINCWILSSGGWWRKTWGGQAYYPSHFSLHQPPLTEVGRSLPHIFLRWLHMSIIPITFLSVSTASGISPYENLRALRVRRTDDGVDGRLPQPLRALPLQWRLLLQCDGGLLAFVWAPQLQGAPVPADPGRVQEIQRVGKHERQSGFHQTYWYVRSWMYDSWINDQWEIMLK